MELAYAEYHKNNPIKSQTLDIPSDSDTSIADSGIAGVSLGSLGVLGSYILSGGSPVGVVVGGVGSAVAGILAERNTQTATGKGIGRGLGFVGGLGIVLGTVSLLEFSSLFVSLAAVLGGILAYNVLYYYLTGKKAKALEIIESHSAKDGDKEIDTEIIKERLNDAEVALDKIIELPAVQKVMDDGGEVIVEANVK